MIDNDEEIGEALARRVVCVHGPTDDESSIYVEVKSLYDLRSWAAQRGLSARPQADSVEPLDAGWRRLPGLLD